MSNSADQTQHQTTAVAAAAEEAAANVETVASAAEELAASVAEISRQTVQSSKLSASAVEEAAQTDTAMANLADIAQSVGDVVKMISDIAGQTNLLALNATIEAARAGRVAKASPSWLRSVKNLAKQTAKATDEVTEKNRSIQSATKSAMAAIKNITSTIAEMNQITATIASAVGRAGCRNEGDRPQRSAGRLGHLRCHEKRGWDIGGHDRCRRCRGQDLAARRDAIRRGR